MKKNTHYQQACNHKKPKNKPKSKTIWFLLKNIIKFILVIIRVLGFLKVVWEIIRDFFLHW